MSPLKDTTGFVRCKDCEKPVLRSAMAEHAGPSVHCRVTAAAMLNAPSVACLDHCVKYRHAAKKDAKGKEAEGACTLLCPCLAVNQDAL